jgi:hypothetical protein
VEADQPPLTVPLSQWRWHLFLRLPEWVEPARVIYLSDLTETDTAKMRDPAPTGSRNLSSL